jgi:uncharacterized protein YhaN
LQRTRAEFTRTARLKANVAAVASKIDELRSGTATEEALEFYVTSMYERLETTHPERFHHVLREVARVQDAQAMSASMLEEMFADEEQEERDTADDGVSETLDDATAAVLVELGCLQDMSAAPTLITVSNNQPPPAGPSGGNSDAGPLVPANAL